MRRVSRLYREFLIAPALVAALGLAGCGGSSGSKPTTSPTVAAKPAAKPAEPKPAPLPSGLSTAALKDFETALPGGNGGSALDLNRPDGEAPQVRVALLLPLTGPAADAGQMMLKAAQLALFDSGQKRLVLMPRDTRSTLEGAREAAREAAADGANLVLGPLFGAHVQAVASVMQPRGVPVIAFSNDRTVAGNGAAIIGLTPETELRRMLAFARQQGLTQIAAFLPDSNFGYLVADRLLELAPQSAVTVERIGHYPAGSDASDEALLQAARDFASYDERKLELEKERKRLEERGDEISERALARLEKLDTLGDPPYQAVLLAEPGSRLATVAPLLAFYDVDPTIIQFMGLSNWFAPGLGTEPTLVGGWFSHPEPVTYRQLLKRYGDTYEAEASWLAALAYDAVAVAADAAGSAPEDGRVASSLLLSPSGYAAYAGPFRINSDGTTDRLLSVLRVEPAGLAVIDPAPSAFQVLTD